MPKSLELFLSYVINGLIIGNIYGLMALGLTLILGVMKIVNFAHGEFYMLGGYAAYICSIKLGLGPVSGILGAIVSVFLIGLFVERALLTPFYSGKLERPSDYALLMTFSLSVFLMNVVIPIFGPYQKASAPLAQGSVNFGIVSVGATRVIASLVAIFLMAALLLLLSKSRLGIALRAIAQDRDAAAVCGIDVNRMNPIAFGIGTAMAAAAGALLAPTFLVYPASGSLAASKANAILVLGGMGSVKGAIIGALLLGVLESLGVLFLSPGYRDVYGFLVIVLVLLIKPTGLFGGQEF
ncbi:MAG: branched-chain amino acid ABC transporter permease [Anaerolineae bacterium]